jgi:hypothetical protein
MTIINPVASDCRAHTAGPAARSGEILRRIARSSGLSGASTGPWPESGRHRDDRAQDWLMTVHFFHLAGGVVLTAPIRERFEIQVVPPVWGRQPFLAVTGTSDRNLPRFDQLGRGRGPPGGARHGRACRILPVVLGQSSSGTTGRTGRVHPARHTVYSRRYHDQRR